MPDQRRADSGLRAEGGGPVRAPTSLPKAGLALGEAIGARPGLTVALVLLVGWASFWAWGSVVARDVTVGAATARAICAPERSILLMGNIEPTNDIFRDVLAIRDGAVLRVAVRASWPSPTELPPHREFVARVPFDGPGVPRVVIVSPRRETEVSVVVDGSCDGEATPGRPSEPRGKP